MAMLYRQGTLAAVLAPALVTLCTYKLRVQCPRGGRASGGVMKKVSSCLWSGVGLVCGDWLAVFGAAWCFVFFLYIRVPKASVPAVSCHGSMQGLNGPFPESLAIQLHSWLLMHSLTHTHTKTHQTPTHPHTHTHTHTHTLTLRYISLSSSSSYKHAFIQQVSHSILPFIQQSHRFPPI